jgi:hypothetical protein
MITRNKTRSGVSRLLQNQQTDMDDATLKSLREILDYLYADEEEHWMESDISETGHIFQHIIKVTEWLNSAAHHTIHETNTKHPRTAKDTLTRKA